MTNEQIRLLISQKIEIEYLIGIALEKLEQNILTECDLLITVSNLPIEFWNENQAELLNFKTIMERNLELKKNELGEKKFEQLNERFSIL